MVERVRQLIRKQLRGTYLKVHSFALGMTLALVAPLVAQGCVAGGQ